MLCCHGEALMWHTQNRTCPPLGLDEAFFQALSHLLAEPIKLAVVQTCTPGAGGVLCLQKLRNHCKDCAF